MPKPIFCPHKRLKRTEEADGALTKISCADCTGYSLYGQGLVPEEGPFIPPTILAWDDSDDEVTDLAVAPRVWTQLPDLAVEVYLDAPGNTAIKIRRPKGNKP